MVRLKLQRVSEGLGAAFPKDVLERMGVNDGDTVILTEMPDGYRLTPCDPGFETQMTAARRIVKTRRGVLRGLAK